ncbi:tetratricopeptide repeat protein [Celeribacter neptunius]|nr:tetratricopeptide repeat protein [Celeribacter neptunius]
MQQEVEALLESPAFQRSKANRSLLKYLADEDLAGRGDAISEYSIAQDLLGRTESFDPSVDPIVRVRMRRLREAIASFYSAHPERSSQIALPRGSYMLSLTGPGGATGQAVATEQMAVAPPEGSEPALEVAAVTTDRGAGEAGGATDEAGTQIASGEDDPAGKGAGKGPATGRLVRRALFAALGLLSIAAIALIATVFWMRSSPVPETAQTRTPSGYPIVAIAPFTNLTKDPANDVFEKSIPRQIAGDFQRFGRARVHILSADLKEEAAGADYLLRGSILSLEGSVDLALVFSDAASGAVLMKTRITRDDQDGDYDAALRKISQIVTGNLTAQGGLLSALNQEMFARSPGRPDQERLGVFRCVVLTDVFLTDYDPAEFEAAYRCFERFEGEFDDDPAAQAALGTLMMHSVPEFHFMDVSGLPKEMLSTADEAMRYAETLADLYPSLDASFILLGAMRNVRGETEQAIRSLQTAVELNPANPTAHGVLAYAYLSADLLNEAREAAQTAVRLSADPAPYLYFPLMVSGLVHKNARLVDMARHHYAGQKQPEYEIVLLAAAAMIGDQAEIERLKRKIGTPEDPLAELRPILHGEIALGAIEHYLETVGVDVPDPTCLSSASGNVSRHMECAQ